MTEGMAVSEATPLRQRRAKAGEPVLSARGLRKEFAGFVAVKDVSLDLYDGQI